MFWDAAVWDACVDATVKLMSHRRFGATVTPDGVIVHVLASPGSGVSAPLVGKHGGGFGGPVNGTHRSWFLS